ncbi:LysR family transcriptional regulator [uncultured Azohydromonas sp.]|uniref:LysR family transcriptional regulator n=1 Tax=uncultured Azohydromonas sp. TaxID=487342 RepID=UPI00260BBCF9|nr:LysR family transcriptional regulator [uncultured Azohydromonas sp.]
MDDFTRIRTFIKVVEAGSFSAAARDGQSTGAVARFARRPGRGGPRRVREFVDFLIEAFNEATIHGRVSTKTPMYRPPASAGMAVPTAGAGREGH